MVVEGDIHINMEKRTQAFTSVQDVYVCQRVHMYIGFASDVFV